MNENLTKKVLVGVSTLLGLAVAGGIYKTASMAIEEKENSEEVEEESK